jgi:hypothetical protein
MRPDFIDHSKPGPERTFGYLRVVEINGILNIVLAVQCILGRARPDRNENRLTKRLLNPSYWTPLDNLSFFKVSETIAAVKFMEIISFFRTCAYQLRFPTPYNTLNPLIRHEPNRSDQHEEEA